MRTCAFVAVLVVMTTVGLGIVALRARETKAGYAVARERARYRALLEERARLRFELAQRVRPDRLDELGETLRLEPPKPDLNAIRPADQTARINRRRAVR